ncbi:uncharacterized protein LOC126787495 [Argentina anserina]|uniref:uncharacterized protein LOC126787495 n=1 Tax=Argentina anserina TaxID=57926 RepID=UPI0021768AF7|nr:uncharacterized protein LOC126787495 [Potentilla anserina]
MREETEDSDDEIQKNNETSVDDAENDTEDSHDDNSNSEEENKDNSGGSDDDNDNDDDDDDNAGEDDDESSNRSEEEEIPRKKKSAKLKGAYPDPTPYKKKIKARSLQILRRGSFGQFFSAVYDGVITRKMMTKSINGLLKILENYDKAKKSSSLLARLLEFLIASYRNCLRLKGQFVDSKSNEEVPEKLFRKVKQEPEFSSSDEDENAKKHEGPMPKCHVEALEAQIADLQEKNIGLQQIKTSLEEKVVKHEDENERLRHELEKLREKSKEDDEKNTRI